MKSTLCKMCGTRSDFIKAHIIPHSFYPKDVLSVMSLRRGDRRRRSPIGIYDNQLVCAGCEARFDPFDNYAAKLLIDGAETFTKIRQSGELMAYQTDSFDYPKLKLFCLSLLWRAAASDRTEFASVTIGPFLPVLTEMIEKDDPGAADTFAAIFCRFSDVENGYSGVITPSRRRYEALNFYSFVMGAYVLYIKVDQRPARDPLDAFIIRPDAPLIIVAREFRDSPEFQTMLRIVKSNPRGRRGQVRR